MKTQLGLSEADREYLRQTCKRSGVPVKITDKRKLRELAAVLRSDQQGSEVA